MIELKNPLEDSKTDTRRQETTTFPPSYYKIHEKIEKWLKKFPQSIDPSIHQDLYLLYLAATKKYLDHRTAEHLFRVVLTTHLMQKKLLRDITYFPHQRHIQIRWIPTSLRFPFSSKSVLGCVIGINSLSKYEQFDKENLILTLQKQQPNIRLVKESVYYPETPHKNLQFFYFEIEKTDGTLFSPQERMLLKSNIEEKVRNSIQNLSPAIFLEHREEELFKNILVLSQEIQILHDLPQASIHFEKQTPDEIVFRVTLVYASPFHHFSLKDCFLNTKFVSERILTVRHVDGHPIEAHVFYLHLPRQPAFIKSDGALDFYAARQKVAISISAAIGEFRDYNGGIIVKQRELLQNLKEAFPELYKNDPDLVESFFYSIIPLEKQAVLPPQFLIKMFTFYLENRKLAHQETEVPYTICIHQQDQTYLTIFTRQRSITNALHPFLQQHPKHQNIAYNFISNEHGVFFNCVIFHTSIKDVDLFLEGLKDSINQWQQDKLQKRTLRIAFNYTIFSLDPRIGGEVFTTDVLRTLFEGLTRIGRKGTIENGIAESIEISPDLKQYIFKLRPAQWNDGSPLTAYDFEYSWKKILSPEFSTAFAYLFYAIKNAKEAKEGKVSSDQIGIQAIDPMTLKVELSHPTHYFLQLTALPYYFPVHRFVDQLSPQWAYQNEKNYPCNGPFQLKIHQANQGYQLIKNPLYWDNDNIFLDQITLTKMSISEAMEAFHKKEIDWVGTPFSIWNPQHHLPEKKTMNFPDCRSCWFVFNTTHFLFQHQKIREAIALAIQRAPIVSSSNLPLKPAYSVLFPHYFENDTQSFPKEDFRAARQLLQNTLDELGIKKLNPLHIIVSDVGIQKHAAEWIQKQLKGYLDIECHLEVLSWDEQFKRMGSGDFELGMMQWTDWIDDPSYTLNTFKSAKEKTNFSQWENNEYKKWIDLSEQEIDDAKRLSYLHEAEKILGQEIPVVPLFYTTYKALVAENLSIPQITPNGYFNIAHAYFTQKDFL